MRKKVLGNIKRAVSAGLALFMTTTMALGVTACGSDKTTESKSKDIDTLKVMVSPYQDADELLTSMEPMCDMIKTQMSQRGYNVGKVELTVGTSYSAVGEALSAGTVDVGFISGGTYVTYDDECDVLLTALREELNKDSLVASDWNDGSEEKFTDGLTTYYRSVVLAGPSAKGQELKAKVDAGQKLTWDDLNSATWAVMGASSASGYIYPSMWLKNNYGKQITDLSNVVQSDSYTTSTARLASGQVDIMVAYAHIRAKMAPTWMSKLGGTEDMYKQTGVLAVTDKILDDTVSVSKNSEVVNDDFKKAFGESMIAIGESEEGLKMLSVISHKGYKWAESADYDAERSAQTYIR